MVVVVVMVTGILTVVVVGYYEGGDFVVVGDGSLESNEIGDFVAVGRDGRGAVGYY